MADRQARLVNRDSNAVRAIHYANGRAGEASTPPLNLIIVDDDEHIREVCRVGTGPQPLCGSASCL
jgi:hypothetical protein